MSLYRGLRSGLCRGLRSGLCRGLRPGLYWGLRVSLYRGLRSGLYRGLRSGLCRGLVMSLSEDGPNGRFGHRGLALGGRRPPPAARQAQAPRRGRSGQGPVPQSATRALMLSLSKYGGGMQGHGVHPSFMLSMPTTRL